MTNRGLYPACLFLYLATALCFVMFSLPANAFEPEKYASLVIDANSGEVLHSDNASRKRHPASLTKLMTLYMTFDALRTGKLRMNTVLRASKKAAGMPSTNLRMKPGSKITVKDAIDALIVRSANDVAVIIAEKLAGSEYKFAKYMTAVSRRLGMKNTTFKNASGLPNRKQITTARDLAILALALRRHYPEYYHLFRAKKFKYKGKTYKSHNRVMSRVSGADGLKTGYIRASGFNLITSATRNNKSVIGVVLGGETSKERDDRMVRLVEGTFRNMKLQVNKRQFVLNDDPIPLAKPSELVKKQKNIKPAAPLNNNVYAYKEPQNKVASKQKPKQYVSFSSQVKNASKQYVRVSAYDKDMKEAKTYKKSNRGQFVPVSYNKDSDLDWGVQVGAYVEPREAMVAAANAFSFAPKIFKGANIDVADKYKLNNKILHRARLAGMTKRDASNACEVLTAMKKPCFVYRSKKKSNI